MSRTAQRGFTIDQRNVTGSADINLTDTTLLSVKAGYFRDDYRDRASRARHQSGTESSLDRACTACLRSSRAPASTRTPRRCEIADRDTTTQIYVQADYSAVVHAGGSTR